MDTPEPSLVGTSTAPASVGDAYVAIVAASLKIDLPSDYARAIAMLVDRAIAGKPVPIMVEELTLCFSKFGTLYLGDTIREVGGLDRPADDLVGY